MTLRRASLWIALANGSCLVLYGCSGTLSQEDSVAAEIRGRCQHMGFDDAEQDDDNDGDEVARGWRCVRRDGGTTTSADMVTTAPADMAMPAPAPDMTMPPPPPPADMAQPAPTVSFAKQVQPIFTNNCAGCHGGNTFPTLTAGTSYSQLVDVASKKCATAKEVVPGSPAQSYLIATLTNGASLGTCNGGFMSNYIQATDLNTITAWIAEGAPNN